MQRLRVLVAFQSLRDCPATKNAEKQRRHAVPLSWHSDCVLSTTDRLYDGSTLEHFTFKRSNTMLSWALAFFILAIIAGIFGFGGIAAGAAGIAQFLFFLFVVLLVISLLTGRFRRTPMV